jgi:DNA primase
LAVSLLLPFYFLLEQMHYPQYFIDELKTRADIVRIVEMFVPLKKKGANFWGNCPFHGEKTPSFSVSPAKGFYKCFGCSKSGTAFNFLMEMEGLNFPEAIKRVADISGVMLPEPVDDEQFKKSKKKSDERKKLADQVIELNQFALEFWERELAESNNDANKAREYLINRGITEDTQKTFRIGYAPETWDSIMNLLKEKGADDKLIALSGLVSVNEEKKRTYDRFRGRLIFPVLDVNGKPIAFGARILDKGEPKYLNSPETPAYIKGNNLYGLFQNKAEIKRQKFVILVEGYLDLISLYQFGVKNTVASLGTAFTPEQAKLLSRFARKTVVNYDGDSAGVKAARRAIEPLLAEDFEIKVLTLPNGQDPDDFIRASGLESYNKRRSKAVPHLQFVFDQALQGRNVRIPKHRTEVITDVLPVIIAVREKTEKRHSFDELILQLNITDKVEQKQLEDLWRTIGLAKNVDSEVIRKTIGRKLTIRVTFAEQRLLELLINDNELRQIILPQFEETDFEALATASIFRAFLTIQQTGEQINAENLTNLVSDDAIAEDFLPLLLMNEPARAEGEAIDEVLAEAERCFITLRLMAISNRIAEISQELLSVEQSGDIELLQRLSNEHIELGRMKRGLELNISQSS